MFEAFVFYARLALDGREAAKGAPLAERTLLSASAPVVAPLSPFGHVGESRP